MQHHASRPHTVSTVEAAPDAVFDITSNQLALLKRDGTEDLMTEFQEVRILAAVQVVRATARFNVVLEKSCSMSVEELTNNLLIWVLK